uniref:Uncharacterized protein n=1 Tax=Anguilla anguilla TaxID=7936 RepID=A0A0E9TBZ4_ANGAN
MSLENKEPNIAVDVLIIILPINAKRLTLEIQVDYLFIFILTSKGLKGKCFTVEPL